jgi:DNA-directed RNA polymerase subunit RPC12/RpoP
MKVPEPKAYVWAPRKKPELAKLAFQAEPSASLKALGYVSAPLYDKQALIDLLEAAAVECEAEDVAPTDSPTGVQECIAAAIKQAHQAQSVKIIEYRDQRIAPCGCHPDEACEQCCPELPKPQAQQAQEPVAWEATTPGYIKYVTDKQYRSYSETAKRWYKPYKCSSCAAPKQAEPAEKRKPYECTGCGHLHEEKPSSCDCCENPGNDYNDWTASPTPPEAA